MLWRSESEAAGEAARLMALPPRPQSYFFASWSEMRVHVVGTTFNDRRSLHNTFKWMGLYKPPSSSMVESWWRSRGLAPWKLQSIWILPYLSLDLILPSNAWMVMHCFMCIAVQSHRKTQRSKLFNSQVCYQKKCVCSIVLAG